MLRVGQRKEWMIVEGKEDESEGEGLETRHITLLISIIPFLMAWAQRGVFLCYCDL